METFLISKFNDYKVGKCFSCEAEIFEAFNFVLLANTNNLISVLEYENMACSFIGSLFTKTNEIFNSTCTTEKKIESLNSLGLHIYTSNINKNTPEIQDAQKLIYFILRNSNQATKTAIVDYISTKQLISNAYTNYQIKYYTKLLKKQENNKYAKELRQMISVYEAMELNLLKRIESYTKDTK
jgi:tRNA(His) 5'-end guanylyltransferase